MVLAELFEDLGPKEFRVELTDLHGVPGKAIAVLAKLARFHQVRGLAFDPNHRKWTATASSGIEPFIRDAKHITSAAGKGLAMTNEVKKSRMGNAHS